MIRSLLFPLVLVQLAELDQVRRQRRSRMLVDCSTQTEPPNSTNVPHHPTTQLTLDGDPDPVPSALDTLDAQLVQLRQQLADLVSEKEALRDILYNELGIRDPGSSESPGKGHPLEPHGRTDESRDIADDMGATRNDGKPRGFDDILLLEEECIRYVN